MMSQNNRATLTLLKNDDFSSYLPGHLNYGPATPVRTKMVLNRIMQLANIVDE